MKIKISGQKVVGNHGQTKLIKRYSVIRDQFLITLKSSEQWSETGQNIWFSFGWKLAVCNLYNSFDSFVKTHSKVKKTSH